MNGSAVKASSAVTKTPLLIVGAGLAGVGIGAMLRRRGITEFLILEREGDLGGTWRDNTYPGISCDVPAHAYSFSFRMFPRWNRLFAEGPEIHHYLDWVARREGVRPHIHFGADATEMAWDEGSGVWRCKTPRGEYESQMLVLACGRLNEPRFPSVDGLDTFADGDPARIMMHSARWQHNAELSGRRVAIVGSGASAVQLVPELAKIAGELTLMQRSAPYIVPKLDRAYEYSEKRMFERDPESMRRAREDWFWKQERVFAQRALVSAELDAARRFALAHLEAQVESPELRERLTPRYEIGCKRVLLSDEYYAAFNQGNVRLVDSALASVEPGVLVARDGQRIQADVAVLATGFHAAVQPYAELVTGAGGTRLSDEWADGMYGFASTSVPGFPNMFVVNGPNAGLGHNSAIPMLETQIGYVIQAFEHLREAGISSLDVKRERADSYVEMLAEMSAETVWMRGGCESWYRDPRNGKLTLLWPGPAMSFRRTAGAFRPDDYVASGLHESK